MPVDLGISNAILNAYIAGHQNALEKQKLAQQKEQESAQLQQRQKEQEDLLKIKDTELKQHQEEFDKNYALNKAVHDLALHTQRQQFAKDVTESGITPPGDKVNKPEFSASEGQGNMPIARDLSGIPQGQVELEDPILGKIKLPSHESYVAQKVKDVEATQGPIRETQRQLQEAETKRQLAVEQLKTSGDIFQKREELENQLKIANINANSRLAAAKARGESDKTQVFAQRIANQFDNLDIRKRFSVVQEGNQFAQSLDPNSKIGTDDTSLIYAYAKTMDPDSAVREGERAVATAAANTLSQRFKFAVDKINSHTQFLSPEARVAMKTAITNKYKVEKAAYDNVRGQTEKQLKAIGADSNIWLRDFNSTKQEEKTVTTKQVQDFATENKVDFAVAKKHFEDSNYIVK